MERWENIFRKLLPWKGLPVHDKIKGALIQLITVNVKFSMHIL